MDSIKETLEQITGVKVEHKYSRELMMRLPTTESIKERLDKAHNAGRAREVAQIKIQLERAVARDEIQATRPEGCFCLGSGFPRDRYDSTIRKERYCPCDEGQSAYAAEVRKAREHQDKLHQMLMIKAQDQAEIPVRFQAFRLSTSTQTDIAGLLARPEFTEETDEANDRWSEADERWLRSKFLWGAYGRGKTGLAVGYAYDRWVQATDDYGNPESMLFRTVPDLLSELRSTYNRNDGPSESDVLERYNKVDVLILDDIGAEHINGSGWVEDRLYQIIGNRHANERCTVFTSNLSIKQLAERIGERIVWRIVEACGRDNIIEVNGDNLRDQSNAGTARGGNR